MPSSVTSERNIFAEEHGHVARRLGQLLEGKGVVNREWMGGMHG